MYLYLKDEKNEAEIEVAYWRKANQIHGWFARHFGEYNDNQYVLENCRSYEIPKEKIIELYDDCVKAHLNKDPKLLPTTEGFFFGSTGIDEWYWHDILDTIEVLRPYVKRIQEKDPELTGSFYYYGSW
jgi:hypothetical protein